MLACCASKPEAADAKRPVGAAAEEGTPPPTAVSTELGDATVSPTVPAAAAATDADGPSAEASSPSSVQNPKNKRMLAYMKQRSGDGERGSPAADSAPLCFFLLIYVVSMRRLFPCAQYPVPADPSTRSLCAMCPLDFDGRNDPMLMSTELAASNDETQTRRVNPTLSSDSNNSETMSEGSSNANTPMNSADALQHIEKKQVRKAGREKRAIQNAEDAAEQTVYLQRYDAPTAIAEEVNQFIDEARALEKSVTTQLKTTASARGGKLKGMDARLKTRSSMTRKILEKLGPGADLEGVDIRSLVRKQSDALRYTMVFTTVEYVAGVTATIEDLKAAGFAELKVKNYWRKPGESTDYAGINSVFAVSEGAFPFELQFHTPESLDTKMQRCHHSYSKFREDRSMVRAQYWEEMVRMWSLVPVPEGVSEIGELLVREVNLDDALKSLSEEERHEIDQVHALERAVKPLCEQAVANTIESEKKVTPILSAAAATRGLELHGMDFRVKSALSMARKVVNKLRSDGVTETEVEAIEASVWCEQRQALRYTVVCSVDSYTDDVLAVLAELQGEELGFEEEFVYNYWLDSEPYNAIRARLWSTKLESWCFLVFHTQESLDMSEARLAYHQRAMGIVFHTASFDESKVADAIQRLRQDVSWLAKVTRMKIPRGVERIERVIMQPTTMKTITEEEEGQEDEDETERDGVTMPSADKGCWHHKVCYKPVETDEDGVSELPADIRQAVVEAKRAEEAGKVDRAHKLYADAVSSLLKLVAEQMEVPEEEKERSDRVDKMTQTFSLANPRLADCALTYISPGFSALTGYEPSEIIGKNCRILQGACLP